MLPDDSDAARQFATPEVATAHFNRMGYRAGPGGIRRRVEHIYVGKIVERIAFRFLREELGLNIGEAPQQTDEPDEFDFLLSLNDGSTLTGDCKSFHIYRTWNNRERTPEEVLNDSWALVPVNQFQPNPKDIYVFAMLLGDWVPGRPNRSIEPDAGICTMRWASRADITNWQRIPRGRRLFPYNETRTDNFGRLIRELQDMEALAVAVQENTL